MEVDNEDLMNRLDELIEQQKRIADSLEVIANSNIASSMNTNDGTSGWIKYHNEASYKMDKINRR